MLAPLRLNGYLLNLLYTTVLYVALAYGWNIISGYAGYFSFGQIAFFGIGAYATGLLVADLHWYWMLAALAGGVIAVRARGPARLRDAAPARTVLRDGDVRNGADGARAGHARSRRPAAARACSCRPAPSLPEVYYWTLAICLGAIALTIWIDRSAFGLRLQALREDEQVAGTLGVDVTRAKITAFALSALIPGLLGGGYALFLTYIEPDAAFSSRLDLQSIVMAILGGVGTVWGPLVGGVVMTQISEALWARFPQIYLMLFGGLLVALLLALPRGIVPAHRRRGCARARRREPLLLEVDGVVARVRRRAGAGRRLARGARRARSSR